MPTRRVIVLTMTVVLALMTSSTAAAKAPPPRDALSPTAAFTVSPGVVASTGRVEVASVTPCPPMQGMKARALVIMSSGTVGASDEIPVDSGGVWRGDVIFEHFPVGSGIVGAQCVDGVGESQRIHQTYVPLDVSVVPGSASAVQARPLMTG